MDEDKKEKSLEERKNRIKKWMSDKYNFALILILFAAFLIRIYLFTSTSGQPLWWDEAEYGSMAKYLAGILPNFDLSPSRPFLFPGLVSLLFMINLSEVLIKFISVLVPSFILIYAVYYLGKNLYDKKIGLIGALLAAFSWTLLFWTNRLQPDFISVMFQCLAIAFMWRYWKENKTSIIIWAGVFASLGYQFKVSGLLVPLIFFIFIFIKERFSFIKKKDYWIFALTFLVVLLPQIVYSQIEFGNPITFLTNSGYSSSSSSSIPFGWYNLDFFVALTTPGIDNSLTKVDALGTLFQFIASKPINIYHAFFFILFLMGLIFSLKFLIYIDILVKDKNKCFDPDLFSIISLVVISAFYVFYIRATEDRWVFLWLPFIFFFIGKSSIWVYQKFSKFDKTFAVLLVIVILLAGLYSQFSHASNLSLSKEGSYAEVKEAGLWLKQYADPSDVIISTSYPQTAYYSERYARTNINGTEQLLSLLKNQKPRFLQISAYEATPIWLTEWMQNNNTHLTPVQAYFADKDKKQAVLVIYQIEYDAS